MRKREALLRIVLVLGALVPAFAHAASPGRYPTVSLTFDDTHGSHRWVADVLYQAGMVGTFYVNSERVGGSGYLSAKDLREMEAQGHEIGGHTLRQFCQFYWASRRVMMAHPPKNPPFPK